MNRFVTLLTLLCICLTPLFTAHATPSSEFKKGWHAFHALLKNKKRAQRRDTWQKVEQYFQRAYKQNPKSSYAPKSLYFIGRTYQELGRRSYLKSDFRKAVDYYSRVVSRYPSHSWSDDAQLLKAKVHLNYLKDEPQAYIDLLKIVHNYPRGDKLSEAKELLRKLDKANNPAAAKKKSIAVKKTRKKTPTPSLGDLALLQKIRHWSNDEYTRVVMDLDREISYKYNLLEPSSNTRNFHRLFIDLKQARVSEITDAEYTVNDGILKRVRAGQNQSDKARVVLDIEGLDDYRLFTLDNPFRVVVDVFAPKDGVTRRKQPGQSKPPVVGEQAKNLAKSSLVEQLGLTVQTIMIDAGHGGRDPGAVANGLYEKHINLKMAKKLGTILKQRGFTVLYTRTRDRFLGLEERTALANQKKADLFISLHCNANRSKRVRGFELYFLNLAKTKEAVQVAARENAVSEKKISDLEVILTDFMLPSKIEESMDLAKDVHKNTIAYLRDHYPGVKTHGVRQAPFYVLMGAQMPAILVEMGYITNKSNARLLNSSSYQTHLAQGLANGILGYKKRIERFASLDLE